jgi:hypothetical protein
LFLRVAAEEVVEGALTPAAEEEVLEGLPQAVVRAESRVLALPVTVGLLAVDMLQLGVQDPQRRELGALLRALRLALVTQLPVHAPLALKVLEVQEEVPQVGMTAVAGGEEAAGAVVVVVVTDT